MPNSSQPTPTPFERPSARATGAMPVQRANYGLPPRQPQAAAPTPAQPIARPEQPGPRSMDIMAPRPTQPPRAQAPAPQPLAPTPAPPAPAPSPSPAATVAEQISVTTPVSQPLYTNQPVPEPTPVQATQSGGVLPKVRLALLILGVLLTLGGAARWLTAGSTSGDLIAAGAIAANDGENMTVQFTANDGQMHKFIDKSDSKLTPGSAVQVAYRSGAPDNSAKRVEPIKAAHSMGMWLMVTGIILLLGAGVVTLLLRRPRQAKPASIAKPVTV